MDAACREHRVALMEAFMYRFHHRTERVSRMAADGTFGDVRLVRAAFTFAAREPDRNIRFRADLGGGALYDVGCYTINVSRMILGEPETAFAAGRIGDYGVDDQVGAILRFGGGRVALIDCGLVLPRREEYEVVGTAARLQVPNAFLPGTADAPIIITRGGETTTETVAGADQYARMVERFGEAVTAGTPPPLAPADAARTLKVIEALLASIRSGQPQPVR